MSTATVAQRLRPVPSIAFLRAFKQALKSDGEIRANWPGHCAQRTLDTRYRREAHGYTYELQREVPACGLHHEAVKESRTIVHSTSRCKLSVGQSYDGRARRRRDQFGSRRHYSVAAQPAQITATEVDSELESIVKDPEVKPVNFPKRELLPSETGQWHITRHLSEVHFEQRYIHDGGTAENERIAILQKLLKSDANDMDELWSAYTAISLPRPKFLSDGLLAALLASIRATHIRTDRLKTFYFTVLNDMVMNNIMLSVRDLNSAMVFLGRSHGVAKTAGFRKALGVFERMEQYGRYRPDITTFNILGDLALAANELSAAKILIRTIKDRGIHPDRYTHLLAMRYHAAIGDVQGIKESYKLMIASGEIIDTIALNALLKCLLKVDDFVTAKKVFVKMKSVDARKIRGVEAPKTLPKQRKLGYILKYSAHELRNHGRVKSAVQETTPVAPNEHTYRLLIEYHCKRTGNMDEILELLAELLQRGLHVTAPIFYNIFSGFVTYRHERFSAWRLWSLSKVFELFIYDAEWLASARGSIVDDRVEQGEFIDQKFDVRLIESILSAYLLFKNGEMAPMVLARINHFYKPGKEWAGRLGRLAQSGVHKKDVARAGHHNRSNRGIFMTDKRLRNDNYKKIESHKK